MIRYNDDGSGWVDAKSNEPVEEHSIKARYEETLLKHTGIRMIEPELFDGVSEHRFEHSELICSTVRSA